MPIAPVLGMGTTYNLPNFHGEIMRITPEDTPFLSAIGGLTGGIKSNGQTEFEWQATDLRKGQKRVRLEGADAPTAQERPRINFSNILEIHQESIALSYTKLAAVNQYGAGALAIGGPPNPITDELSEQLNSTFKSIALDLEYDFLVGTYNKPSDNTTARATRGLLPAIKEGVNGTSNAVDLSVLTETGIAADSATGKLTSTATGLANGDQVVVTGGEAAGLLNTQVYYVVSKATNDFRLALTSGGTPLSLDANATGITVAKTSAAPVTKAQVIDLCQRIWKNGGLKESFTATVMVGASQHRGLSDAFITNVSYQETTRDVGGVAVNTIITEFGRINLMLSRTLPEDAIVVASLEQCAPVFLEIPGKGYMFVEELARTGASVKKQLYGEVGLKYGNPLAHGVLTGAKV